MQKKEIELQNAVCEYLSWKKHFFWRQNTTPTVQKSTEGWQFRRMPKYAKKGVPDVIVVVDGGYVVFLEIKSEKGYLSQDQKLFQAECKRLGAEYHVIRKVEQLAELGL